MHHALCWACDYLSTLELKSIHVSKMDHWYSEQVAPAKGGLDDYMTLQWMDIIGFTFVLEESQPDIWCSWLFFLPLSFPLCCGYCLDNNSLILTKIYLPCLNSMLITQLDPFDISLWYRYPLNIVSLRNYRLLLTHLNELIRDLDNIKAYITSKWTLSNIGILSAQSFGLLPNKIE